MAAGGFPTSDLVPEVGSGEYLGPGQHAMAMASSEAVGSLREAPSMYQIATGQNPQGEVGVPQVYGSFLPWSDLPSTQHTGALNEEMEQRFRSLEVNFGMYDDTPARHEHQQHSGETYNMDIAQQREILIFPEGGDAVTITSSDLEGLQPTSSLSNEIIDFFIKSSLEVNSGMYDDTPARHEHQQHSGETYNMDIAQQREILIFPEGEDDAVTITGSDLEGLQPTSYLSNNIIDFYIKFLERRLSSEDRERFYFFSSFFFTKLVGDSRSIAEIHECGVGFDRVRRWTGEVNLFEKDYVFVPILRSSHWSLIIVGHLNGLTNSPDKRRGSPCIYHLDPVEGKHKSFEDQIRSYMIQSCTARYRDSNDRDRIILALACEMKYVRAQVPQQGNGHDCGVYLLHYVEVFLRESTSPDFNFASASIIWGPHFAEDASAKRTGIQRLIFELSNNRQEQASRPMDIESRPPPKASDARKPCTRHECLPIPPKGQSKLSKKWRKDETKHLLERMVEGSRIGKGTKGAMLWDLISQDIKTKLGYRRTEDECRRRYDTLLKAYKKVKQTGKPFWDITGRERVELNLATPLTDEWYRAIDTICLQRSSKSQKRAKPSSSDGNGLPSGDPSRKQIAIPGFSTIREDLRFTLVGLIQGFLNDLWINHDWNGSLWNDHDMKGVSRMLAIVQDRKPWEIRSHMYELSELKLVDLKRVGRWHLKAKYLELANLRVFKKFVEKVIRKNPDLDIYLNILDSDDVVSFPKAPASSSLQRIRVLSLYRCSELKQADLSCFPELRFLAINECPELRLVTGWEVVTKLGWLEISDPGSYVDFPPVQYLTSLREFRVDFGDTSEIHMMNSVPDFSQCVRLRSLAILSIQSSALNYMDLSMLRFLEVLTLWSCDSLTTIQGLSGLHSLTSLDLSWCTSLRRVPELACLTALTDLCMSESGVEEIHGVQELYVLTSLHLRKCDSLKMLPFLGHLKALAFLDIRFSGVEEIPGVQGLVSLETLKCDSSKLKWLPDLHHLPQLREVSVRKTPLSEMVLSSFYFGKDVVLFNSSNAERKVYLTEISDISDTE